MQEDGEPGSPPTGRCWDRINEWPQNTLVMLSGGLDSVYTLYRLLTETADDVLVHHMILLNNSGRHRAELKAAREVVRYCNERIRTVRASSTTIDHRGFNSHGRDYAAAAFQAAVAAMSFERKTRRKIGRWTIGLPKEEAHDPACFVTIQAIFEMFYTSRPAPKLFMFRPVTKQEQADALPYELYRMSWSCRRPVVVDGAFRICGTCKTCERMKSVRHRDAAEQAVAS